MLTNKYSSHTHTRANAHTRDEDPSTSLPSDIQPCGNLASARAAKRMSNGNSATVEVHFLIRNLQVLNRENSLAGKSFVDLEEVNVVLCNANQLKNSGNSEGGSDTHDTRRDANNSGVDIFSKDGKTKAFGH